MGLVIIGATFVDIKGFPFDTYIPTGRNAGTIQYVHGGVSRNVAEDIANLQLNPTFISIIDKSALGQDVVSNDVMNEKPRNINESIFANKGWLTIIGYGIIIGLLSLSSYLYVPINHLLSNDLKVRRLLNLFNNDELTPLYIIIVKTITNNMENIKDKQELSKTEKMARLEAFAKAANDVNLANLFASGFKL